MARERPTLQGPMLQGASLRREDGSPLWVSHEPEGSSCPFCELAVRDVSDPANRCALSDLVFQDEDLLVFMACDGFGPYEGHAMIAPVAHREALYDLDDHLLARIGSMSRDVALAVKLAWDPEGTSVRQHNEPAGNQHVWHYHMHVFPRYSDDKLYRQVRHPVDVEVRAEMAQQLRAALQQVLSAQQ